MQLQEGALNFQGVTRALPHSVKVAESGRMVLVRVLGPLDMVTAPSLTEALQGRLTAGRVVVVDLRRADFIDSAGIRGLLSLTQQARAHSGEVRLVIGAGSRVERTMRLLQLMGQFPVFRSTCEAWINRPSSSARLPV